MPTLLDLYCGEGGAAFGYAQAGYDVTGVDLKPQPRYPYEFVQGDALQLDPEWLREFDVIHSSPPCQQYTYLRATTGKTYPDLVDATRDLLRVTGRPYVIENVPNAPLLDPVLLCGSMFTECSATFDGAEWCFVDTGTSSPASASLRLGDAPKGSKLRGGEQGNAEQKRQLMRMPWATAVGCSQAVPPAYTRWIGRQILARVAS